MNRLLAIFSFLLCIAFSAQGQNLVPNPSFEHYDTCPDNLIQLDRANHWFYVSDGTSDYFNACDPTVPYNISIPQNFAGYQLAHTGNGYAGAGFSAGDSMFFEDHFQQIEYLGVELIEPMKQALYKVSFYVSLADSFLNLPNGRKIAGSGINIFNCRFSTSTYFEPTLYMLHTSPNFEVKLQSPVIDSLGWTKIEGYFYSQEQYKYMVIGQLNRNYNEYLVSRYETSAGYNAVLSYYYYDDIEVVPISEDEFPNIFTPNGDGINDVFDLKISCTDRALQLQIYNRWGQQLEVNNTFKWDGTYNGNTCFDGVYYYVLHDTQNQKTVHSGFVQLTRNKQPLMQD